MKEKISAISISAGLLLTSLFFNICMILFYLEHGLIISGSKDGTLLIHTSTGDLLRNIMNSDFDTGLPIDMILLNRECQIAVFFSFILQYYAFLLMYLHSLNTTFSLFKGFL
jgi:hypothetical protein